MRSNEGTLALAEETFAPDLQKAKVEVLRRYSTAATCLLWSRVAGWLGFLLTSAMTVLAGIYGGVGQEVSPTATLADVIKEQKQSKGLVRALGVLIAVSTLPGVFSQRLQTEASQYTASARELNKVLINASEKLYDSTTTKGDAIRVQNELVDAMEVVR